MSDNSNATKNITIIVAIIGAAGVIIAAIITARFSINNDGIIPTPTAVPAITEQPTAQVEPTATAADTPAPAPTEAPTPTAASPETDDSAANNCFNEAVRDDGTIVGNQLEDNGYGVRLILMINTSCFEFPLVVNILSPGKLTWQGHTLISEKSFQLDSPRGESMQIDATITCGPEFCSQLPINEQKVTIQVGTYQLSAGPAFNQ